MLTKQQTQRLTDAIKRERMARKDLTLAYRNGDKFPVIHYLIDIVSKYEEELDVLIGTLSEQNHG